MISYCQQQRHRETPLVLRYRSLKVVLNCEFPTSSKSSIQDSPSINTCFSRESQVTAVPYRALSGVEYFSTNCTANTVFPTPPAPTNTSLYSVIIINCPNSAALSTAADRQNNSTASRQTRIWCVTSVLSLLPPVLVKCR